MILYKLVVLLALLESNFDPYAKGDNGKAIGELQIHPIMVEHINGIIKKKTGIERKFCYEDRFDWIKSRAMCMAFLIHERDRYIKAKGKEPTAKQLMKAWNSGSINRPCTAQYACRVREILAREN